MLRAIATDPELRKVKLIAEPWDVGTGGWRTGGFPAPFAEWNDAFRNDIRSFWLADRAHRDRTGDAARSEEHTSELSHVAISYAVFCLKKTNYQYLPI